MVRKVSTTEEIYCDIGGEPDAKMLRISYDGRLYEGDYCKKHVKPILDWAIENADLSESGGKRLTGLDRLLRTSQKDVPKDQP